MKSDAIRVLTELARNEKISKGVRYPAIKPYRDNKTNDLTRCVKDYIRLMGGQAERVSTTGRLIDNTKEVVDVVGRTRVIGSKQWRKSSGKKGSADIHATIWGRSVKIEIKCKGTRDNKQSDDQKSYQAEVEKAGGIYLIVRDFEQFYKWYEDNSSRYSKTGR